MLPVKTTLEDVRAVVAYLRTKPAGATVAEAKGALGTTPMDGRKLNAYQAWGLVRAEGDTLYLEDRGRRLASQPEAEVDVLRAVIKQIKPYSAAIDFAYHQNMDNLSVDDLAAQWHNHYRQDVGTDNETTLKAMVTCFFNLADGAGLGTYVRGRRGAPTRLELNKAAMEKFIEAGPSDPPWTEDPSDGETGNEDDDSDEDQSTETPETHEESESEEPDPPKDLDRREDSSQTDGPLKVFISHGSNMKIVEQVETILDLADIQKEIAVKEETAAVPVPKKVMDAMRRCRAGIICVSVDEAMTGSDGNFSVNPNVLIEIGAAFVLYDERVVLLWDKRLTVPSNLQGLYRCEFEGENLDWDAGTKLMKAVRTFRDGPAIV